MKLMRILHCIPRKKQIFIFSTTVFIIYTVHELFISEKQWENREFLIKQYQKELEESLRGDKGAGCDMPVTDPLWQFYPPEYSPVICGKNDWVKCYRSKCKVVPEIRKSMENLECFYRDIIYKNDFRYTLAPRILVRGDDEYHLKESDYVVIFCVARIKHHRKLTLLEYVIGTPDYTFKTWGGYGAGLRPVPPPTPPPGRENTSNILIFEFDSVSRNAFIRHMPKTFKFLQEEMNAVILKGYNVVGDGTTYAIFPLLSGKMELEHPEYRKNYMNSRPLDPANFIFGQLKNDGYRTAYYEDMPWIGTFQLYGKGFVRAPTDHSLMHYFQKNFGFKKYHCVGDTPIYQVMMDITDQFLQLDGKKFVFTSTSHLSHDVDMLNEADQPLVNFLKGLIERGFLKNTMILVMGDHGPRHTWRRITPLGKIEQRLPFMAIRLPDDFTKNRPEAKLALETNADVVTTPYDIYTTIMDLLDLRQHWNHYEVLGADMPRAMTLLEPIPKTRSCSEAGITAHWCACLKWTPVEKSDPMYAQLAHALVDHINSLTQFVRSKCAIRTLTQIHWVTKKVTSRNNTHIAREDYQVQITIGPGEGIYEATITNHIERNNKLTVATNQISRINRYRTEPACISDTYPHVAKFCYCY